VKRRDIALIREQRVVAVGRGASPTLGHALVVSVLAAAATVTAPTAALAVLTGNSHLEPLTEWAEVLPVYVRTPGAKVPMRVPGVVSIKRKCIGDITGKLHSVQLALAEPLLVHSSKSCLLYTSPSPRD